MKTQLTFLCDRYVGVAGLVVALAFATVGVALSDLSLADAFSLPQRGLQEAVYPMNEMGLTYGNIGDAPADDCEPDLIEAVATNGKEGYIRNSELAVASHEYESPAQAMRGQEAREREAATLLQAELNAKTENGGVGLVEAREALGEIPLLAVPDGGGSAAALSVEVGAPELSQLSESDLLECYLSVDEALMEYIPVYLSDGVTVVGEFPVSQL